MKNFFSKYKFQTILVFIFLIFLVSTVGHINQVGFEKFFIEFGTKDEPFHLVNIAIALAAISTAVFTWWKNSINQKQTEIQFDQIDLQKNSRLDSLFAQAVEFLKSSNDLITRKAGVHILKDLAVTSPIHAQKCIDMLCSLNEAWIPKFLDNYPMFFELNENFPNIKNIEDIILYEADSEGDYDTFINHSLYRNPYTKNYLDSVSLSQLVLQSLSDIIRYISSDSEYYDKYNLSYKYLCSIDLNEVKFNNKFNFANANLQSADLSGANLQSADLFEANLQSANVHKSDFSNANLLQTDFRNALNIDTAIFGKSKKDAIFTDEDYKRHYPKGKPE